MRPCQTACVAVALLVLPFAAFGAPARVTVFEAQVHTAPDPSSPVIYVFAEGAWISVSETAVDGFRKVRVPDGRTGYIEDSAISPAAAGTQPPGPPPGAPPPAPFAVPPPPPPPPPGAYAYAPYRRVMVVDPTARRHVGFFMRLDFGFGYASSSTSASQTLFIFNSAHGVDFDFAFAIGGAVKENAILAGEFWSSWVASPTLSLNGASVPSGYSFSTSIYGLGPNFTWYIMPANVYISVTPSVTWMSLGDAYSTYQTNTGFGARFALGKQWWTGPHWGLGISGWFTLSYNPEGGGSNATWETFTGGMAFTSTVN